MFDPRLPVAAAIGAVLLTSMPSARATAVEPSTTTPVPYVIAIDPGHGGSATSDPSKLWDPGVVAGPVMEKDLTLDIALRLRKLLEAERVTVVMTRTADQYVEISQRWFIAHQAGARMFVSLHVNAFEGDPTIGGATVFYPRPDSLPLAQAVEAGLRDSLSTYRIADDGVAAKPELWIHADVPTVTVEPAYLSNPREAGLLQRPEFRQAIAAGVYRGLLAADPQIDVTRAQLVKADAALAAARRSAALAAARTPLPLTPWAGRLLLIGALLVVWLLLRERIRARREVYAMRRRSSRRRPVLNRRTQRSRGTVSR